MQTRNGAPGKIDRADDMECELNQYDEKLDMTRDFALDLAIWLPAGNGERQDEKHLQVGACTRLILW